MTQKIVTAASLAAAHMKQKPMKGSLSAQNNQNRGMRVMSREIRNLNEAAVLPDATLAAVLWKAIGFTLPVPAECVALLLDGFSFFDSDVFDACVGVDIETIGFNGNGNLAACEFLAMSLRATLRTDPFQTGFPADYTTRTGGATPVSDGGGFGPQGEPTIDPGSPGCPADPGARNAYVKYGHDSKIAAYAIAMRYGVRVILCDVIILVDAPLCEFLEMDCGQGWQCCGDSQIAQVPLVRKMNDFYNLLGIPAQAIPMNAACGEQCLPALGSGVTYGGPSMLNTTGCAKTFQPIYFNQFLPVRVELYPLQGTEFWGDMLATALSDEGYVLPSANFDETICGTECTSGVRIFKFGRLELTFSFCGVNLIGSAYAQYANYANLAGIPPVVMQGMSGVLGTRVAEQARQGALPAAFLNGLPGAQDLAKIIQGDDRFALGDSFQDKFIARALSSPMRQLNQLEAVSVER